MEFGDSVGIIPRSKIAVFLENEATTNIVDIIDVDFLDIDALDVLGVEIPNNHYDKYPVICVN